jgi:hypothetical protein
MEKYSRLYVFSSLLQVRLRLHLLVNWTYAQHPALYVPNDVSRAIFYFLLIQQEISANTVILFFVHSRISRLRKQ